MVEKGLSNFAASLLEIPTRDTALCITRKSGTRMREKEQGERRKPLLRVSTLAATITNSRAAVGEFLKNHSFGTARRQSDTLVPGASFE